MDRADGDRVETGAQGVSESTPESLGEQAYRRLRDMIVRLELAPGDVLREDVLRETLGLGRTPIREALQRLDREHFVTVIPRRGMFVSGIDVSELSMLFETRMILEPYAAQLAARRGTPEQWDEMERTLDHPSGIAAEELLDFDKRCHEIMWEAASNRFLTDTLDTLYAQSDRLWHLYLSDVSDMEEAVDEHKSILGLLRNGDADGVGAAVEAHVRSFDEQIRSAVTARLESPLAG